MNILLNLHNHVFYLFLHTLTTTTWTLTHIICRKKVYRFLSDDVMLIHSKYIKWRQEIGPDFCESLLDYGRMHQYGYTMTNVPKLRSFQYRLLQRGIITNIQLCRWGIVSNEKCSFCMEEPWNTSSFVLGVPICEHNMEIFTRLYSRKILLEQYWIELRKDHN